MAVRQIVITFLSEYDAQFSVSNSYSNHCRGSRSENEVGLNNTDGEYVILKLKKTDQKQILSHLQRLSRDKAITASTNKTKMKRCKKVATTAKKGNKENKTLNDCQIAAAVQQLEDVIQFTLTTLDNDIFLDEEF